jgi:hypothetical protein
LCYAGDAAAEDKRHTLAHFLTNKESTKDIPGPLVGAMLSKWLKPEKDSGGEYKIDPLAIKEAQAVYALALQNEGQAGMDLGSDDLGSEG